MWFFFPFCIETWVIRLTKRRLQTLVILICLNKAIITNILVASYIECLISSVTKAIKQYSKDEYFKNRLNSVVENPKLFCEMDRKISSIAEKSVLEMQNLFIKNENNAVLMCLKLQHYLHDHVFYFRVPNKSLSWHD